MSEPDQSAGPGLGERYSDGVLRWSTEEHLRAWADSGKPVHALVPEFDDYLRPEEAERRFAAIPQARVTGFPDTKHLWVGKAEAALDAIVRAVAPGVPTPLPTSWDGPAETKQITIVES